MFDYMVGMGNLEEITLPRVVFPKLSFNHPNEQNTMELKNGLADPAK